MWRMRKGRYSYLWTLAYQLVHAGERVEKGVEIGKEWECEKLGGGGGKIVIGLGWTVLEKYEEESAQSKDCER